MSLRRLVVLGHRLERGAKETEEEEKNMCAREETKNEKDTTGTERTSPSKATT